MVVDLRSHKWFQRNTTQNYVNISTQQNPPPTLTLFSKHSLLLSNICYYSVLLLMFVRLTTQIVLRFIFIENITPSHLSLECVKVGQSYCPCMGKNRVSRICRFIRIILTSHIKFLWLFDSSLEWETF